MSFDGKYIDIYQKRIKGIIDFYGHKFFYYKKVLDLGCGYGDIGASLLRLGADVTAIDARQEHLKIINKKYPEIKTIKADFDKGLPAFGKKFDIVLDLDLICHISNYEDHLRQVCLITNHLILETAVCDHDDPYKNIIIAENKSNYDLSFNGNGSRPTAKSIERILRDCGMDFKRIDQSKFNSGAYKYDWQEKNNGECNASNRRLWFAVRNDSPVQFQRPTPQQTPPIPKFSILESVSENILPSIKSRKNDLITLSDKRRFVITIPSYKNEQWCIKNIESCLNQEYDNYRIIFTDDASPDNTFNKVSEYVKNSPKANKVSLIRNTQRIGALANLYNMIHSCDDDEIILTLDGDDWFPDNYVLSKLSNIYSDQNIWMTYGQYKNSTDGAIGVANSYPQDVINNNSFRSHTWGASHLRTFYSWLFKKINKEDLCFEGKFLEMTWDLGIMFPMLEMSGNHSKFISDILYVYNMSNPINDHKVNRNLQQKLDRVMRSKAKYSRIEKPIFRKLSIGLMMIATGKYFQYVQPFISSADKYFLDSQFDVTYYVFTDKDLNISSNRNIKIIPIEHKPFPFASMDRFKHFTNNYNELINNDYLYYCDVDSLFVNNISREIFGDLVGVRHCGYFNLQGPFETNEQSCLYIPLSKYKYYFGGGFSGGTAEKYLELSKWCNEMIDKDVANGIIPIWHDETAINRYFADNNPSVILSPSYHYPQSNIEVYKKKWAPNHFEPKILLLDKNHKEIRG